MIICPVKALGNTKISAGAPLPARDFNHNIEIMEIGRIFHPPKTVQSAADPAIQYFS